MSRVGLGARPARLARNAGISGSITCPPELPLTVQRRDVHLNFTMLDWHVRSQREGQESGQPSTHASAEGAIEEGNRILGASEASEVTVFHRLYSNQACLTFSAALTAEEIQLQAGHLERLVLRAARSG